MAADSRSLDDLERDAERTRAEFAGTVDQLRARVSGTVDELRQRVSPDALKAEASAYLRTRGEALIDSARRNPLQAVAIGAGVAYPLWGIVRAIPAPVLMIGAGLFLAGPAQKAARKAAEEAGDLPDRMRAGADALTRAIHDGQDYVAGSVAATKEAVTSSFGRAADALADDPTLANAAGKIRDGATTAAAYAASLADGAAALGRSASNSLKTANDDGQAGKVWSSLSDSADDLQRRAVASVKTTIDAAQAGTTAAAGQLKDAAATLADRSAETLRSARASALESSQRAAQQMTEAIEQHPLLVAGIGFAIGALVASALPRSDIERGLIGPLSAEAKRRAADAAAQGYDTVKTVAADVYGDVIRRAGEQGLDPDGVKAAASDIGQRMRTVAETAAAEIFAPSQETDSGEQRTQL